MRALSGIVCALLAPVAVMPAAVRADVEARVTLTSAYLSRGLQQSRSPWTGQAALEYQNRGWFAGVWASRVGFGGYDERDAEVDYYAGYGRRLSPDLALEATAIRYTYRGESPRDDDWNELQISAYLADRWTVTWGVSHNWWATGKTTQFLETTYRYPLPAHMTFDVTAGYQAAKQAANVDYGYAEAGVARRLDHFVVRLGYATVDSNARNRFPGFAGAHWVASVTWQR